MFASDAGDALLKVIDFGSAHAWEPDTENNSALTA